ncbi:DUF309 domain-containing protein [Paenibacillus swuensis]
MEELWLEEGRSPLYQGLLQIAVGLYHFQGDNLGGAVKLMEAGLEKLSAYPHSCLGINLELLRVESGNYLRKLKQYDEAPFSFYPIQVLIIDSELERQVQMLKLAASE